MTPVQDIPTKLQYANHPSSSFSSFCSGFLCFIGNRRWKLLSTRNPGYSSRYVKDLILFTSDKSYKPSYSEPLYWHKTSSKSLCGHLPQREHTVVLSLHSRHVICFKILRRGLFFHFLTIQKLASEYVWWTKKQKSIARNWRTKSGESFKTPDRKARSNCVISCMR